MRVFGKLFTAVRGSMRETAEQVVDAHALRICEQEIYECESAIRQAKQELACVVAEKLRLRREIHSLERAIEERETQAVQAVQAGEASLAQELAELIAEKERILTDHRTRLRQMDETEARLQKNLRAAIQKAKHYRHELRMVRAMASSQRALRRLTANTDTVGGKLAEVQDSLVRIRQTQADFADHLEATEQINRSLCEEGLNDRIKATLKTAEFDPVESVLARIQKKAGIPQKEA